MIAHPPQRKYRIERYLAEGGMGAIYVGKKIGVGGFEKEVVLKQLLPEFTERPEFRDLFFREAKISASLDHVNIVRTSDLVSSDESLFIVMEYVRGADLRTINWRARMRRKALSPRAVLHVAMEILAGLAYAHGRKSKNGAPLGIIHRDVSPSNILCSGQGDVKLSDFGIAKATTFSSVFYRVRGKVGYMSPEQARNETLDARSDLFSLSVCIFETLTGERLFAGDLQTPSEELYGQPLPKLSEKRPDLPAELEDIMAKSLSTKAEHRFAEAAAFGEALREVARKNGLLYSAPLLAAELHELLGPDADTWSQDETLSGETERMPAARTLEGKEATSIKEVDEPLGPDDLGSEHTVSLRPKDSGNLGNLGEVVTPPPPAETPLATAPTAPSAGGAWPAVTPPTASPSANAASARKVTPLWSRAAQEAAAAPYTKGRGFPAPPAEGPVTPALGGVAPDTLQRPPERTLTPLVGPREPDLLPTPPGSRRSKVVLGYLVVIAIGVLAGVLLTLR
ncbi:MAG TPA: serine/threonine-protein kinase [Polyangia bacterium]